MTANGRIERFFSRIGLAATAVLLLLALLALDLWLTDEPSRLGVTPADDFSMVSRDGRQLGWSFDGLRVRLMPLTLYENEPSQRHGPYVINARGLRGAEVADGPPRAIVLGGSAAFGLGVGESETLAHHLGERLGGEVLNAGVIGYLSSQESALAIFRLDDLEPDLWLSFSGWNDLYDPFWWSTHGPGGASEPGMTVQFELLEARLAALRAIEHRPSRAFAATGMSVLRGSTVLSGAAGLLSTPPVPEPRVLPDGFVQQIVQTYVANMRRLQALAEARGARLFVVIQPEQGQLLAADERERLRAARASFDAHDAYWERFPELYRQFRAASAAALTEAGLDFVDGSELLPNDPWYATRIFNDPVHLDGEGYRLMAERIAETLERRAASPDD